MVSDWPLLTGGRCSEVAVNTGLTVPMNGGGALNFFGKFGLWISFSLKKNSLWVDSISLKL
jgi:hypothetical protein